MGADNNRQFEFSDINVREWSLEAEKRHLERTDVGVMPLENNDWSRSKGGYKILLYMSMGVACVASPIGINSEIIKDGINGYLADTPEEWLEKLSLLIEDYPLRQRLGEEGRKAAEKLYSYNVQAPKIIKIFRDFVSHK